MPACSRAQPIGPVIPASAFENPGFIAHQCSGAITVVYHGKRVSIQVVDYISFLVISTLVSYVSFPKQILDFSNQLGKVILTIAMVAIGLKIKFKTLWESGKRGLLFGAIVFGAMLIFLFTLLFLIN